MQERIVKLNNNFNILKKQIAIDRNRYRVHSTE